MIELDELMRKAAAEVDAMSPEERRAMYRAQAESLARAEAGFGSDKDEEEYATAIRSGNQTAIAECERKAQKRVAAVDAYFAQQKAEAP